MAMNFVRETLNEKLKTIDIDPFLGYVPIGSLAKGTMTKESDYDVMMLTAPKNFRKASYELGHVFSQINDHYFVGTGDNIDVILGPPAKTLKYSLEPQAVKGLGGEVFHEWEPIQLQEALRISSIARTPLHVLWFKEVGLGSKRSEIAKLKIFLKKAKINLGGFQAELLTHLLGSFENTMKRVATGEFINYDFHDRKIEELKDYPCFRDDLMIVTDPVDENRNAFGKLTKNTEFVWDKLVFSSTEFLDNGEIIPKPLPSGYNYSVIYDVSRFLDDNTKFTKLFGTGAKCIGLLKSKGYRANIVDISEEEGLVILNLDDVSETFWHMGPELEYSESCEKFLEKNKGRKVYKRNGRLYVKKERPSVEEVLIKNGFEVQQVTK